MYMQVTNCMGPWYALFFVNHGFLQPFTKHSHYIYISVHHMKNCFMVYNDWRSIIFVITHTRYVLLMCSSGYFARSLKLRGYQEAWGIWVVWFDALHVCVACSCVLEPEMWLWACRLIQLCQLMYKKFERLDLVHFWIIFISFNI